MTGAGTSTTPRDYFDKLYGFARNLIERGLAYVDSHTAEEMRAHRGTLTEHGRNSPFRDRAVDENLKLLQEMKEGKHADGSHVLRAKIDMQSGNINLRDPAIYRIRHADASPHRRRVVHLPDATTTRTARRTRSSTSLTRSARWSSRTSARSTTGCNERLAEAGLLEQPLPQQIEFARLNLTYVVLSKRKLIQLVDESHVDGWDDPRMPTLVGARRRGYTPEGFRLLRRSHRRRQGGFVDRLLRSSRIACAST